MENKSTHSNKNILFYILVPLIILSGTVSYFRFIVNHDYIVGYEGVCDPTIESCFIGCEDDECTTEYYYTKIQKYGSDLYAECEKDITDCEGANMCLPSDRKCSIVYCDMAIDGSDACYTEKPNTEQINPTEKYLQDDNISDINI